MPLKVESVNDKRREKEGESGESKHRGKKRGNNQIGNKRVDYLASWFIRISPEPSGEYYMRAFK